MKTPVVSVVIPVFNREDLVVKCLKTLFEQDFQEWEAIVVDDGSTDNTTAALAELALDDKRISLISRDPLTSSKGACSCRNIGLGLAVGKYVVFHDSDDLLHPRCLAQRVLRLEEEPDLDFVVSPTLVFRDSPEKVSGFLNFPYATPVSDMARLLRHDSPWWTSGPTWRRSFLLEENLHWPEDWERWQDWRFNLEVLSRRPRYKRLELFDTYYREGNEGIKGSPWNSSWVERISGEYGALSKRFLSEGLVSAADVAEGAVSLVSMLQGRRQFKKSRQVIESLNDVPREMRQNIEKYARMNKVLSILFLGKGSRLRKEILRSFENKKDESQE